MKRSNILLVLLTLLLVGGCVAFCVVFLFPTHEMRERPLSPHTQLRETIRISRTPPPSYEISEQVVAQTVLFDGKAVWSYRQDGSARQGQGFHVSPNEDYLVIEDWLHVGPIIVIKLKQAASRPITVAAPQERDSADDHYYVYPFGFVRWSEDSKFFIVKMEGTCVRGPGQFLAYRELWQVQPDTGQPRRLHRQEQPWAQNLVWADP